MSEVDTQYEIHLHGDIPLRHDVEIEQIENALAPLWKFNGATTFSEGSQSYYQDEPGFILDRKDNMLQMCWTVQGDDTFDAATQELCQSLNALAREGAPIEVSYFDLDEESEEDEYQLLFVGPTAQAIIQAQRDLLVKETLDLMERHFETIELAGIVAEIDRLFEARFQKLKESSDPVKALWTGIPFTGLCDPQKRRLH